MTMKEEFSRVFHVRKLPPEALTVNLTATPEECAALAERLGILACESVSAELTLLASEGGKRVTARGRLAARVTQACVVSLEPVPEAIDEPLELLFLDESLIEVGADEMVFSDDDLDDDEPIPDPIVRGAFDVGAAISESLALALDPYPRREDAVFAAPEPEQADEPKRNPFAALKVLQGGQGDDTDGNET